MTTATKEVEYTSVFEKTLDSKAKTIVHVGGAGSSKSHSIAQLLIGKLTQEEGKVIGICRKTFPALRMTAMKLVLDLLKEYGFYNSDRHSKSFNTYSYRNSDWGKDSVIQFFSLDEAEKIKSANFNYIWMEESNEFTYEDYRILKLRLRNPTTEDKPNQMYLSLNPIDAHGWIPTRLIQEADVEVIHSTYQNNKFLTEDYVKSITDLINQDANFYKIYALGEWGLLQRRIYTNYKVIPQLPEITEGQWAYGLDFGLVNPSAIVKVYRLEDKFYLEERLYKTGLTNKDIIEFFTHEERGDIYADPSAKQMIEEICRAGFNCYEAHKNVKDGIDLCQRQTLYIPESSVNIIKEIQAYQWKVDKDGNVLPEPIKFNDHCMDDIRYAIYGLTERFGFPTARPGGSEPQTSDPGFRF